VAGAQPCGQFARIIFKEIAHDRIKLAHDLHPALDEIIYRGGGVDVRLLPLRSLCQCFFKRRDVVVQIVEKAGGQSALDKLRFERERVRREHACGRQEVLIFEVSCSAKLLFQSRHGDGHGAGGFSGTTNVSVGSIPISVAVGDFNNDGKQDIAAANISSNTVSIRLGGCNLPPNITAATGLSRQQGSAATNSTIATVTDDGGNGNVVVTVTTANPSNGVTISNIVNTNGTITADIVAACNASNASFTLQANDGISTTTDTLNITVAANTAPTLTYGNQSVASNGSTTINPATGPTDNGSVSSIAVQSQGTYTGTISVNSTTGVVSVSNAAPVGTHTITIRATDNCGMTKDATFTLTVNKGDQTITVNTHAPSSATYNTQFTVSATSSSGLPVAYSSSGSCTNAGATFTMTSGTGTCTVKYDQAGDGTYNAANQVTESVTAQKAAATVTLGSLSQTYDGTAKAATATTNPSGKTVVITYSQGGNPVASPTNAGSYDVSATINDPNYQGSTTGTLVISKAAQTITFGALPNKTYRDAPFTVSATASSGLSVTFSIFSGPATINGNTITITGVGHVVVRAAQAGNTNYNAAPTVDQAFDVTTASATIALSNLSQVYDGTPKAPMVVTTPAGLSYTLSYTQNGQAVTSPTNVGNYNVTATITDANYQGSTSGILVITKATPVITWNNPSNIVYGTPLSNTQLNATANVAGTFSYNPPSGTILNVGAHQLSVTFTPADTTNYTATTANVTITVDQVTAPALNLDSANYTVNEGDGFLTITVNRTGNGTTAASVDYTTSDTAGLQDCNVFNGIASSRCDYATTIGTLHFVPGETFKTISIPIVDDSYAEGSETFKITLSNAVGENLGVVSTATITIVDNDAVTGTNPLNDQLFFIRQQYVDFLGRVPDPPGYQGWQNVLNNCPQSGIDANGNHCDRIEVSADFFRSEEFQTRGYFIYRFYKTLPSVSDPNNPQFGHIPHYAEFMPALARVSGFLSAQQLEDQKAAFVTDFMARSEFQTKYGSLTDPTSYVTALLQTVGLPNHPTRQTWIDSLTKGSMTKAQVLRALIESSEMYQKNYNEAFVIMQYFGYLRRDADSQYAQWIQTLNQTGDYRMMINGFLNSIEYRQRFGP
jgi:hypothetical protein